MIKFIVLLSALANSISLVLHTSLLIKGIGGVISLGIVIGNVIFICLCIPVLMALYGEE